MTFDPYLTLTWSLTFDLDDLEKLFFSQNLWFFLKSRDVKAWRRTSKRRSLTEAQPTGSYGPLCDFTKVVTLTLTLTPILPKKLCQGTWARVHQLYKFQKDRTSIVACRAFKDGQTDRQTDRQTAVTNILCKNLRFCKVAMQHLSNQLATRSLRCDQCFYLVHMYWSWETEKLIIQM